MNRDISSICKMWGLLQRTLLAPSVRRFSTQGGRNPLQVSPQPASPIKESKVLSKVAERALWASFILQHIQNAKNPSNITDQSLRNYILSKFEKVKDTQKSNIQTSIESDLVIKLEAKGYTLSQDVRQQFSELFREGFPITKTIFSQSRISQGTQDNSQFIFCPNLLVTKFVVDNVVFKLKSNLLMCGGYGVSKTISLMMIWHLTNYINTFKYHAWQRQPNSENLYAKQYEDLRNMIVNTPKFWYRSVDLARNNKKKFSFKQILLKQAVELSKETKQQLRKIKQQQDFMEALQSYYTEEHLDIQWGQYRGWKHCLVIDQINEVTSQIRKWNESFMSLLKTLKDLKTEQKDEKQLEKLTKIQQKENKLINQFNYQLENTRPKIQKYIDLVNAFINFGKKPKNFLLNSSMDIEDNLLKQKNSYGINDYYDIIDTNRWQTGKIFLSLALNKHKSYERKNVPYNDNFAKQWGRIDYLHFFWFEVQRRLLQRGIVNQNLRQIFLNTAYAIYYDKDKDQITLKNHYRIVFCNSYLRSQSCPLQFQDVNSNTSDQEFTDKFKTLLSRFDSFNLAQSIQRVKQFLKRGQKQQSGLSAQKQFLMRLLYYMALYKANKGKQKEKITFPAKKLSYIISKHVTAESLFLSKEHNHKLIPVRFDRDSNTITFDWTAQDVIQILASQVSPIRNNFFSQMSVESKQKSYMENKDALGRWVEYLIQTLLQKGANMGYYYRQYDRKHNEWQNAEFRQVEIFERTTFTHFNSQKGFVQFMKDALDIAKKKLQKQVFATPINDAGRHARVSEFIDFAYIQYLPQNRTMNIKTFDVTVQQKLSEKFANFCQFTEKAYERLSPGFLFTHTYFSRRDSQLPKLGKKMIEVIDPRLRIRIAYIEDVNFLFPLNAQQPLELVQFQSAKEFIKNIDSFLERGKYNAFETSETYNVQ